MHKKSLFIELVFKLIKKALVTFDFNENKKHEVFEFIL